MVLPSYDFVIIGAGSIGLFLAHQLKERDKNSKILILEKETRVGLHTSGRNSGVLHAGIYYEPKTLKAKVCQSGAKRLKNWIIDNSLPLNKCGKVVIPQEEYLDSQIDILYERSKKNNVDVEILEAKTLKQFFPDARSATGRALWSPNTCVTNPTKVLNCLVGQLISKGIDIRYNAKINSVDTTSKSLKIESCLEVPYGHLFNCAGAYALEIAQILGVGENLKMIPFKGSYWNIKKESPIIIPTNLYPVPDLSLPFLGVHFTPSAESCPTISVGPTASLAMGRESYNSVERLELLNFVSNMHTIGCQYISNRGSFRKYVHEQSPQALKYFMLKQAKKLIPSLKSKYLEKSLKVGIRPQLFSKETKELVQDFMCITYKDTTHILNGVSPAFTASFELADLIINQSKI